MLKFEFDPERPSAQNGRNLLGVSYARMDPVRSTMELPATEHMQAVGGLFICCIASLCACVTISLMLMVMVWCLK